MKLIHFSNYLFNATKSRDKLIQKLNNLLSYEIGNDYNVDVFGVNMYKDKLPKDFSIVDHNSRETLLISEDGIISTNEEDIHRYEYFNTCTIEDSRLNVADLFNTNVNTEGMNKEKKLKALNSYIDKEYNFLSEDERKEIEEVYIEEFYEEEEDVLY